LFRKPADYDTFLRVLDEALERCLIRLLAYYLMPTHRHFVLWPGHNHRSSEPASVASAGAGTGELDLLGSRAADRGRASGRSSLEES
jgi:hypothetical protein